MAKFAKHKITPQDSKKIKGGDIIIEDHILPIIIEDNILPIIIEDDILPIMTES